VRNTLSNATKFLRPEIAARRLSAKPTGSSN